MNEKINPYNFEKASNEAERIKNKATEIMKGEKANREDYQEANNIIDEENRLFQGNNTVEVFGGKSRLESIKRIYGESAEYFADIIKERLPKKDASYSFADFGTHGGDLLKNVLELLDEYDLHTIGIDVEKNMQGNESAQEKIPADLTNIPLEDKSVDFGMSRYVLAWNSPERQQKILKEISRIIKDFAIIQHAGSDNENSVQWRQRFDDVFDGEEVPKLERHGYFYSSREEIESWMKENNINFQRLSERRIENVADAFIERFALSE